MVSSRTSVADPYPLLPLPGPPGVSRQGANPFTHLGVPDSSSLRTLREQAGPRQSRQIVGFQAKDVARAGQAEVDSGVSPKLEGTMRLQGGCLKLGGDRGRQLRRKRLFGHARRVLALVVEELVLGHDLPDR